MKKNILLPLILGALLLSGWRLLEGGTVTREVTFDYIRKAERTAVDPIVVTRARLDDSVRLILPIGGTQTDAELYAGASMPSPDVAPLARETVFVGTPRRSGPVLDMTGLKDGSYTVRYAACYNGAVMSVVLVTRDRQTGYRPTSLD